MVIQAFVDSTVLIDILRHHPPALSWFANETLPLGITPITAMEVVRGAKRKQDLVQAIALLSSLPLEYQTPADFDWAMQQFERYWLSHQTGMNDCLIASVAHRLNIPLYTHNLKHIRPVLPALAQTPY